MSAVDSCIELFRNICKLASEKIDAHFTQIDKSGESNPETECLRVSMLTGQIANQLNLKEMDILNSINLYARFRPDLEIRNGKISRIGDDRTKAPMTPKECALKYYNAVKSCAPDIINNAFNVAEEEARGQGLMLNKVRVNFQNLCNAIAEKLNIKSYSVYHCLKQYVNDERKDLIIALGRQGGLMKR